MRIRDVYTGSRIRIFSIQNNPNFFPPGSASKNLSILTQKRFLSSRKYNPGFSSRIQILTFYPSRIPNPGVKKAPDPGSGSATLLGAILIFNFWAYYQLCILPESPESLDTGGAQLLVPALQPAQRQLALVSHAGHLRTHRLFTAHAQSEEIWYIMQPAQRQLALLSHVGHLRTHRHFTRDICAHTDILLRMRKVEERTRKSCS